MTDGDLLLHLSRTLTPILTAAVTIAVFFWRINRIESRNVGPQPFVVKMQEEFHKEFASRKEFLDHKEIVDRRHAEHAREIATLYRKLESDKEEIIHAGEDRATKIHDRINVVIEKVGELRGEMNGRHA